MDLRRLRVVSAVGVAGPALPVGMPGAARPPSRPGIASSRPRQRRRRRSRQPEAPRVEAGAEFEIEYRPTRGDYVTGPAGSDEWTNEPYFGTADGNPNSLVAPTGDGNYELWYVSGDDESVLFRLDIAVTPFAGDLLAEEEVPAGQEFEVAWNGPMGRVTT